MREKSYFDQLAGRYKYCKELKNFKNTGTCSYTSILDACLVLNIENFSSVNTGETFFIRWITDALTDFFLPLEEKNCSFPKKFLLTDIN